MASSLIEPGETRPAGVADVGLRSARPARPGKKMDQARPGRRWEMGYQEVRRRSLPPELRRSPGRTWGRPAVLRCDRAFGTSREEEWWAHPRPGSVQKGGLGAPIVIGAGTASGARSGTGPWTIGHGSGAPLRDDRPFSRSSPGRPGGGSRETFLHPSYGAAHIRDQDCLSLRSPEPEGEPSPSFSCRPRDGGPFARIPCHSLGIATRCWLRDTVSRGDPKACPPTGRPVPMTRS